MNQQTICTGSVGASGLWLPGRIRPSGGTVSVPVWLRFLQPKWFWWRGRVDGRYMVCLTTRKQASLYIALHGCTFPLLVSVFVSVYSVFFLSLCVCRWSVILGWRLVTVSFSVFCSSLSVGRFVCFDCLFVSVPVLLRILLSFCRSINRSACLFVDSTVCLPINLPKH